MGHGMNVAESQRYEDELLGDWENAEKYGDTMWVLGLILVFD